MPATAVIGLQWGDEAKAKIVDSLNSEDVAKTRIVDKLNYEAMAEMVDSPNSEDVAKTRIVDKLNHEIGFHYVVRYNGGSNAGHTVIADGVKKVFHLIPSAGERKIIADGVAIDPFILNEEMALMGGEVYISNRAKLVMPQNMEFEGALEGSREDKIGTTKRGMGPTYAMQRLRTGFRVCDLVDDNKRQVDKDYFWGKLQEDPLFHILKDAYGITLNREEILETYTKAAESFKYNVTDTAKLIRVALARNFDICLEGAQGAMLDNERGTYPFVTSSHPGVAGIAAGTGVPIKPERIVGIVKAYTTRVGGGPFPTELENEIGERMRKAGGEYGATTGRPRRCGWIDLVQLTHTIGMNEPTEIALTKVDVLDGFDEIAACTKYNLGDKSWDGSSYPARSEILDEIEPFYTTLDGWDGSKGMKEMPNNLASYVGFLEKQLGVPITMISNGPDRNELLHIKK